MCRDVVAVMMMVVVAVVVVVLGEDAHGQRVKLAHTILLLIQELGTGQDLLASESEIEPRIRYCCEFVI